MSGKVIFRLEVVDHGEDQAPEVRYRYREGVDPWRATGIALTAIICGVPPAPYTLTDGGTFAVEEVRLTPLDPDLQAELGHHGPKARDLK